MLFKHSPLPGSLGDAQWITQTLDVTRRRSAETRLAHQASHDALTGRLNRGGFCERAQAILDGSRDEPVALLFCDVDDFKVINDSLGHAAGDELLVDVAQRLASTLRTGDLIGRFGGDEFVICLRDVAEDQAGAAAVRIAQAMATPFFLAGVERRVTVSVGVTIAGTDERSIDFLARDADLAMYEAKAAGKARHVWFGAEMRERAIDRLQLETDLREAVTRGAIDAHFQPQVRVADQRVVGFEALARWQHPVRGNIPPSVFIPLAEHSGLIGEIGAQVLRLACRQAQAWAAAEPALGELRISMNASPRCICDPELPAQVRDVLRETGVAPERVCIEITESAVIDREASTQGVIDELKALGVSLAIDDFGIGQSSLSQLARLGSLDELKIDKAFIDDITTNRTAQRLTGAIIDVATGDGLTVVAEGVEEPEQLEVLRELGCPTVQGYLYSRPLPGPEFLDFMRETQGLAGPPGLVAVDDESARQLQTP
jgi:diguanylate cyclase (GGDEF)-like protein